MEREQKYKENRYFSSKRKGRGTASKQAEELQAGCHAQGSQVFAGHQLYLTIARWASTSSVAPLVISPILEAINSEYSFKKAVAKGGMHRSTCSNLDISLADFEWREISLRLSSIEGMQKL